MAWDHSYGTAEMGLGTVVPEGSGMGLAKGLGQGLAWAPDRIAEKAVGMHLR